ncbi:hypothetical protein AVEN_68292-1 [Araneus ventricosus]|uniref:Uncharacterized protein n=1 Tax=Araneus ventricosus TaxID=182803 RepID=A0A4Y2HLD3_ARAVE|nr:hypothetical protein AVEN_68292-1 [Araneus ventricosus]
MGPESTMRLGSPCAPFNKMIMSPIFFSNSIDTTLCFKLNWRRSILLAIGPSRTTIRSIFIQIAYHPFLPSRVPTPDQDSSILLNRTSLKLDIWSAFPGLRPMLASQGMNGPTNKLNPQST